MLNIAGIILESIVDGPGVRSVIFTQGCKHNCKKCHNPETHSFKDKDIFTKEKMELFFNDVEKNPLLSGLTISGGEPFQNDLNELLYLIKRYKLLFPEKDIWIYTGYTIEELFSFSYYNNTIKEILSLVNVIVDGEYIDLCKDLSLRFKGSSNQRIIYLENGNIIDIE